MSGKKSKTKTSKPNLDFSILNDDWKEVEAQDWNWVMWNEEGETLIGWLYHMQDEEFRDKTTGEIRTNLVAYMIKVNPETNDIDFVRFIVPTDLRRKFARIDAIKRKEGLDWNDIALNIEYNGKIETTKGYKVKSFSVKWKKASRPNIEIPPLPGQEEEDEEYNFDF